MNILRRLSNSLTADNYSSKRNQLLQLARSAQSKRVVAQLMQRSDSLTKKDIASWRTAWQQAIDVDSPRRGVLLDIYADCLVDLHLTGCMGQRKGKTLQKQFRIIDASGKENTEATKLFEREWFSDFMELALDSRFFGHSLIQLGDVVSDNLGMRFSDVQLVNRKHVIPEYGVITREPNDDWRQGISYRDTEFADWVIEVGKPHNLGLLLKCAPQCISKKNMLGFWDMFGEMFGLPIRIAKSSTTDAAERANIERALDDMGAAFWALLPDGTDIEIKESSRGDAYNVFDRRVDRCNSEISKGTLMQTMTIDSGSSLSQSETHLEIFEDVIEADARMIRNVVNDRLIPLMIKHGFPLNNLLFQWDDAATFTPAELREEERMLLDHFDIDPQYFIDKYNIPITGKRQQSQQSDLSFREPSLSAFFD